MSLSTYTELQAAIASWLARDDLTQQIPDFIALAEARIRRNQQWFVEVYSVTEGSSFVATGSPMALPSYVREILSLWAASSLSKHTITILPPEAWRDMVTSNRDAQGIPSYAAILPMMDRFGSQGTSGGQLCLWPAPGSDDGFAVDFLFVRDIAPLSTESNALFVRHPDLWLYGALAESAPFLQHDERTGLWESRYQQVVKEVEIERERVQYGASSKRVRLPRVF